MINFRTSSYSHMNGNCIAVGNNWRKDGIAVRDSKDLTILPLTFTPQAWEIFIKKVKTAVDVCDE